MITQSELKDRLSYDPVTGVFIWLSLPTNHVRLLGMEVGTMTPQGYKRTRIKGRQYLLHRLAWLYVYGVLPQREIDHVNGIRHDNRLSNLRCVTHSENMQNLRRASVKAASGLLGASFNIVAKKFVARIVVDGKRKHLGLFATAEAAHEVYLAAKRRLHSTCSI